MLETADPPIVVPEWRDVLELRTTIRAVERELVQLQLLAEEYVLTRVGVRETLFLRGELARYTVDRAHRRLRALPPASAGAGGPAPRPARVDVRLHAGRTTVHGHDCRRLSVCVELAGARVATESYFARLPGLERTALHAERLFAAPEGFPAHLLDAADALVLAESSIRAGAVEQRQASLLTGARGDPVDVAAALEALHFPRVEAGSEPSGQC